MGKSTELSLITNEYFAVYKTLFRLSGLPTSPDYFMSLLWKNARIAVANYLGVPFIGSFTTTKRDAYGEPVEIRMRGAYNSAISFERKKGDFVLIDLSVGDTSPLKAVETKLNTIYEADLAIRLNIKAHQIPRAFSAKDEDTKTELQDLFDLVREEDEDPIVIDEGSSLVEAMANVKVVKTDVQYMVGNLQGAKGQLKSEVLSLLGINYNAIQKNSNMVVDEVNANDALASMIYDHMTYTLQTAFKDANEKWGFVLKAEPTLAKSDKVDNGGDKEDPEDGEKNA